MREAWHAIMLIAGVFGIAAGAGLLAVPRQMLLERTLFRRWLFEINFSALLNRKQSIERPLYRHHRIFGATVTIGAMISLMPLFWLYVHPLAKDTLTHTLGIWGARAVILSAWALVFFVLAVGLFLLIRPSALKGFEAASNRWIEPFPSGRNSAAIDATGISRLVLHAPRLAGLILLAAGLGCLLAYSIS